MRKTPCWFTVIGLLMVWSAACTAAPATSAPAGRPNIVNILVDDLGWQDIAAYYRQYHDAEPVYETPNLDRLCERGTVFMQAYSPAPNCTPSRAAVMRGQYPARTGVYSVEMRSIPRYLVGKYIAPYTPYGLEPDAPTLAKVLKAAGYVTGHVGKWHMGGRSNGYPHPTDLGFDYGHEELSRLIDPKPDYYKQNDDGYTFQTTMELSLAFLEQTGDQPFFLNYWPLLVHGPILTRNSRLLEHYRDKMDYDFAVEYGVTHHWDPDVTRGKSGHVNPWYAGMVDTLDYIVGRIMAYLNETDDPRRPGHKLIENTYVVISSDNGGWMNVGTVVTDNAPLKGGKQSCYEGGIRVPFIVLGPDIPAGESRDTPINLIDLFPTFLGLAGVEADPALELDGCDILPVIKGKAEAARLADGTARESIFWYLPSESHMAAVIRKGNWKLLRNWASHGAPDGVMLFKLYNEDGSPNDLGETEDLAEKESAIRDALLAELNQHLADAGTMLPYRHLGAATDAERAASPAVLKRGSKDDRIWVALESGEGKVGITEAYLLVTLNPPLLSGWGGRRQEWLRVPAQIRPGRIEATMPPGATHGVFCLRDANDFLIHSEPVPGCRDHHVHDPLNEFLEDGYAYRPGLFALIALGEKGVASSKAAGLDPKAIDDALAAARTAYHAEDATEKQYCDAIRALRKAIREREGIPQANNYYVNRFPYAAF